MRLLETNDVSEKVVYTCQSLPWLYHVLSRCSDSCYSNFVRIYFQLQGRSALQTRNVPYILRASMKDVRIPAQLTCVELMQNAESKVTFLSALARGDMRGILE